MKLLSVALMVLGIVALFYGGIGYNRQTTILSVGGMKATATEHKALPIVSLVGGMALLGGVVLLVTSRRRLA